MEAASVSSEDDPGDQPGAGRGGARGCRRHPLPSAPGANEEAAEHGPMGPHSAAGRETPASPCFCFPNLSINKHLNNKKMITF